MVYEVMMGDLRKPLGSGWEAGIKDPLLREDIADAACGDPAKRLGSAADLAERLLTLEQRRIKRDELESSRFRAQVAEHKLAEARPRPPSVLLPLLSPPSPPALT